MSGRKEEPGETSIGADRGNDSAPTLKVEDRRHWARQVRDEDEGPEAPASTAPTIVDELRSRAEAAERRLQEYIEAFKAAQVEQERVRARLARDVERKADLRFGSLVAELLDSVDDLDLALDHVRDVEAAASLAEGVALARDRFLAALERAGVERLDPLGETFDPNSDEAVRVDPVDDAERDGVVTETLRPGFRLGDLVVRPAKVAVGRVASGA